MLHIRWRRATMAAVASLCASAAIVPAAIAAPGDLPDLVQSVPTAPAATPDADTGLVNWGGFFDDHSIGGDNHMGWSHSGSDPEALSVRFQSTLSNVGNGALELCGYPSSSAAWLRSFQTTPGDLAACPGNAPATGASGWFRYAVANHSSTGEFNRWHLMDLQRFALVPTGATAAAGARTQWDSRWGTCMNDNQFMDCEHDANANRLQVGIAAHADKVTEEGAPDQTVVAFPNRVPNGTYQLVAISNPYGAIREAGTTYGSVSCVALQVTGDEGLGEWKVYGTGQPANCQLPTAIPGALTGPGGTDPFAGANPVAACNPLLTTTGHCWDTIPVDGAHPLAHTNVHDNSTATATRTVAQYGAVGTYGGGGGGNPGAAAAVARSRRRAPCSPDRDPGPRSANPPKGALTLPTLEARKARSYTRTALRRTFGTLPTSAKVTCRATGGANQACTTSWKRSGKSYTGTVRVWFTSTTTQVSWNYDLAVQRKQHGHRTTTTTRGARVGGTVA